MLFGEHESESKEYLNDFTRSEYGLEKTKESRHGHGNKHQRNRMTRSGSHNNVRISVRLKRNTSYENRKKFNLSFRIGGNRITLNESNSSLKKKGNFDTFKNQENSKDINVNEFKENNNSKFQGIDSNMISKNHGGFK